MTGPVLGVDGIVGDGGVEPQTVALLAVVERALERARAAAATAPAPATTAAATAARWPVLVVLVRPRPRRARLLGSSASPRPLSLLGLKLSGDQRVILGAQIDLIVEVGCAGGFGSPSASNRCSRLNAWIC